MKTTYSTRDAQHAWRRMIRGAIRKGVVVTRDTERKIEDDFIKRLRHAAVMVGDLAPKHATQKRETLSENAEVAPLNRL